MRKAFSAYGFDLKDKDSEIKLNIPKSLPRISDFHKPNLDANGSSMDLDAILSQKWSGKLTKSSLGSCALCGSTTEVEMHHLRKVSDVRQKIRTGNASFKQWEGAVLRKQIPLCKYHHNLYHKGHLSHADMTLMSKYSKNLR